MKKRILTIAAILLAVALLCVCTLPIKTEIDLSLPGGRIDFDGNVISGETVTIRGWLRNYLLRDDTMELHLTFPDLTTHTISLKPADFAIWARDGFLVQDHAVYVNEWERAASCTVYLSEDSSWYLIRLNNRLFYGSSQGGPSPAEILAVTGVTK